MSKNTPMNLENLRENLYIAIETMDREEIERLRSEFEKAEKLYPNDAKVIEIANMLEEIDKELELQLEEDDAANNVSDLMIAYCDGDVDAARRLAREMVRELATD